MRYGTAHGRGALGRSGRMRRWSGLGGGWRVLACALTVGAIEVPPTTAAAHGGGHDDRRTPPVLLRPVPDRGDVARAAWRSPGHGRRRPDGGRASWRRSATCRP